jgi:hypothetical protein
VRFLTTNERIFFAFAKKRGSLKILVELVKIHKIESRYTTSSYVATFFLCWADVLGLGVVAVFEALTFNLALNFF